MEDELFLSEDDGSIDSEEEFSNLTLLMIRENLCSMTKVHVRGDDRYIQDMTDDEWQELGRDISNNTHLKDLSLYDGALNDSKMSFFFRGLKGSSTMKEILLNKNRLTAAGVRSMVPFLQNANNLLRLDIENNNIQSEGFNTLLRALRDSPIEMLFCTDCVIGSIEIDSEHKPKQLKTLFLCDNIINADGCRELAKLLQGGDSTLTRLILSTNMIRDEGVAVLVDALQNNISLSALKLEDNGISNQGMTMLLKLVNNISSIKATLQSNHTLTELQVSSIYSRNDVEKQIQRHVNMATSINLRCCIKLGFQHNPEAVGKEKLFSTQLSSSKRAELAELQGVRQSLYSEISPLHLPEVFALVCRYHGQGELYVALKSSVVGIISIVNRMQCLLQQRAHHEAAIAEHSTIIAEHRTNVETIEAEIAAIEEADDSRIGSEPRNNKRRRA